jgi:hypothetical protein
MPRGIPNKPRAARVEGEGVISEPAAKKPSGYVHMLQECVDEFVEKYPDDWEALKLCPLMHGLDTMIDKLSK